MFWAAASVEGPRASGPGHSRSRLLERLCSVVLCGQVLLHVVPEQIKPASFSGASPYKGPAGASKSVNRGRLLAKCQSSLRGLLWPRGWSRHLTFSQKPWSGSPLADLTLEGKDATEIVASPHGAATTVECGEKTSGVTSPKARVKGVLTTIASGTGPWQRSRDRSPVLPAPDRSIVVWAVSFNHVGRKEIPKGRIKV